METPLDFLGLYATAPPPPRAPGTHAIMAKLPSNGCEEQLEPQGEVQLALPTFCEGPSPVGDLSRGGHSPSGGLT